MTSITQCPHCQTRFQVERFQLDAARGLARCGACLTVFNARRCLIQPVEPLVQKGMEETPPPVSVDALPADQQPEKRTELPQSEAAALPLSSDPIADLFDEHEPLDLDWHDWPLESFAPQGEVLETELLRHKGRERQDHWTAQRLWWSWGIPALVLVGGVLATTTAYITLNFEALAAREATRPWIERLCQVTGCELPKVWDGSVFQGTDLVVRPHPDFKGALLIEAILQSQGDVPVPFPRVEMQFADVNGLPLASRQFGPSEYLGGGLASRSARLMPNKPVAIRMVMLDPGEHAVNYSLNFRAPE